MPTEKTKKPLLRTGRSGYVVAMLLGTALLAPAPDVRADAQEATARAVADMSRYCVVCWRNARLHPDSWADCTQEVFSRLLAHVAPDAWDRILRDEGDERREFLRAIDAVKKRMQRARKWSSNLIETVADRNEWSERRRADDREAVAQAAAELLSSRQQRIVQLSFEGWSVQDIASEMRTPAERISDEKYKAIHKLRAHLSVESRV